MTISIYIHLPYCLTKCPYCDFNSYGTGQDFPELKYTDSILKEIDLYDDTISGNNVATVFFGGGTPSLFSAKSIGKILDKLSEKTKIHNKAEITLEVNPRTADAGKLGQFKEAGINRISVGVQSFLHEKLDYFKRFCDPEDCIRTLHDVCEAGFDNYNIDLMYGGGGESLSDLEYDLNTAISLGNKHLSVYCLTIEDNTEFGALRKKGLLDLCDEETLSEMYLYTSDLLEDNGFIQYETSNFARDGYQCRHNLAYWRSQNYIGFGAGAHSHLGQTEACAWGERWSNFKTPKHYMNAVSKGMTPVDSRLELGREISLNDTLMMGLRLKEGLDLNRLRERFDVDLNIDSENYIYLVEDGYIVPDRERLKLTKKGFLFSDRIIVDIISNIE